MNPANNRTKNFVFSLVSGYGLICVNVLNVLLGVPIALHYLTKAEFGLWALVTQITSYVGLIDLGMSGAVARTLVDHKDNRLNGTYGSVIRTSMLVGAAQCVIICAASLGVAWSASGILNVDASLRSTFAHLVFMQGTLLGLGFMIRFPSLACMAYQRYDVINNASSIQQVVNIGVLWGAFYLGSGIYSLLWAYAAGQLINWAWIFRTCRRLNFLPSKGQWGKPTWPLFCELFAFGKDVFLWNLGAQLLNASQVILITRVLGLEAGAVWSIGVRFYNLLGQFIFRIFDFASGAFAEMMVRHERERLMRRFRSVVIVSSSLAAAGGVMYAVINQPFIEVWTQGRISWPLRNDILLGMLLVCQVIVRAHSGLVGQTKKLGAFRYLYFIEGSFFVAGALWALPRWGITGMICMAITGILLFSLRYGFQRTCRYFDLPVREVVVQWSRPMGHVLAALVPWAAGCVFLAGWLPPGLKLPALAVFVGGPALIVFLRRGLDGDLKCELMGRIPAKAAPAASFFLGKEALASKAKLEIS